MRPYVSFLFWSVRYKVWINMGCSSCDSQLDMDFPIHLILSGVLSVWCGHVTPLIHVLYFVFSWLHIHCFIWPMWYENIWFLLNLAHTCNVPILDSFIMRLELIQEAWVSQVRGVRLGHQWAQKVWRNFMVPNIIYLPLFIIMINFTQLVLGFMAFRQFS